MKMSAKPQLLFIDTFDHSTEELNLDLIQFSKPTCVFEVRIIPLGAEVSLNKLGKRLGATNPSRFQLEMLINNLNQKKAPTFQSIGFLDYCDLNTRIETKSRLPTDGLIVKGWYKTITIAVYGYLADRLPQIDGKAETAPSESTSTESTQEVATTQDAKPATSGESVNSALYGAISTTTEGTNRAESADEIDADSQEDVLAGDIITTDETGYDDNFEVLETPTFNPYQFEASDLKVLCSPAFTDFEVAVALHLRRIRSTESGDPPLSSIDISLSSELYEETSRHKDLDRHDEWILAIEKMLPTLHASLGQLCVTNPENYAMCVEQLVNWTMDGLDMELAMMQPLVPFKVRHIKTGLRLAEKMLCISNEMTNNLLTKQIDSLLISLLTAPNMAVSVRLLVVRAIDSLTSMPSGIRSFTTTELADDQLSGYQRLINIALLKQENRIMVALAALLRKIHFYETLLNFEEQTESVNKLTAEWMAAQPPEPMDVSTEPPGEPLIGSEPRIPEPLNELDSRALTATLNEMIFGLKYADHVMAQPSSWKMPSKAVHETPKNVTDPYTTLYRLLADKNIVKKVTDIMNSPFTVNSEDIFSASRDLLLQLAKTKRGLLLIHSNCEDINGLIRLMLNNEESQENELDETSTQALGLYFIYRLQVLELLDEIKSVELKSVDDDEILSLLHALYTLTIIPIGREALTDVLAWYIRILIDLIKPCTGLKEDSANIPITATLRYVSDLVQLTIQYTDDVTLIEPHIKPLFEFLHAYVDDVKVTGPLLEWLAPYKEMSDTSLACVPALTKMLRSYVEQLPKLEVGLLTCLRIMHKLAIDEPLDGVTGYVTKQLCFQYALLEMYSKDCLADWIKLLESISERHMNQWQRGIALPTAQRDLLLSLTSLTLPLVRKLVQQLIEVRGTEFHDTSFLPTMFKLFMVMCSVPMGGVFTKIIDQIQTDIVDILASFTQPETTGPEVNINDAMSRSLWTEMIKKLLNFTVERPCHYLAGTLLLSELLPIQLPIQTRRPLNQTELDLCVNKRTLWSAHLLPASEELEMVITTLTGTSCHHLQHAIRRVCAQLADLNAHFSQFVTRVLLKTFVCGLPEPVTPPVPELGTALESTAIPPPEQPPQIYEASVAACNVMSTLSQLAGQPPVKTALLHFLRVREDGPQNYSELFDKLLLTLNTVSEKQSHNQCQEDIVSLLSSLCDVELSLSDEIQPIEIQLLNELPDKSSLEMIIASLLKHIGNYDHGYNSILLSLRTLVILTDYDQTFSSLKRVLLSDTTSLFKLFTRINDTFSKDSSDCISTLSTALDLLRLLVSKPNADSAERDDTAQERAMIVRPGQLTTIVNWGADHHPLDDLEKLLVVLVEESLEGVVANITYITKILHGATTDQAETEEPMEETEEDDGSATPVQDDHEPGVYTISEKFSKRRSIYVITEPDLDKMTPAYWLTNLMAEDSDCDEPVENRIAVDLIDLCEKQMKDFNLENELKKVDEGIDTSKVHVIRQRIHNPLAMNQEGKSYIAPMRGKGVMMRGRGRGRGSDAFRNRPPNTSRPPSVHVDNFQESDDNSGEQQIGVVNNTMRSPMGMIERGRGRMRFNTNPDGGSFGGMRGGRGLMRGSPNNRGFYSRGRGDRFFPTPDSRGFGRGGMPGGPGMRDDRHVMGPPMDRYGPPTDVDRRYNIRVPTEHRDSSRGGYLYPRDDRLMMPPRSDRDRPGHYRSFTK